MNSLKLKQIAFSLCVVLSLFASSIAACGCSHHQEKVETDAPSCHRNSADAHSDEMPMSPDDSAAFNSTDECVCVQAAPRVFAKSEFVKIEKQAKAKLPKITVSIDSSAAVSTTEILRFAKPFYLSDSFYSLKSPRAPPVL